MPRDAPIGEIAFSAPASAQGQPPPRGAPWGGEADALPWRPAVGPASGAWVSAVRYFSQTAFLTRRRRALARRGGPLSRG
eukprot:5621950-Pyramimonas_sp.AAC.1